jgi:hypothetical protein
MRRSLHYLPVIAIVVGFCFAAVGVASASVAQMFMRGFTDEVLDSWVRLAVIELGVGLALIAAGLLARWRGV